MFKWAPGGNPAERNLKLQGELFFGDLTGTFNGVGVAQDQWGWYLQAIYQFMPRWRFGVRHDEVKASSVDSALTGSSLDNLGESPQRESAMLDYSTSEFGRFRIQYNYDRVRPQTDHQLLFQYTVSFGAHGAHSY